MHKVNDHTPGYFKKLNIKKGYDKVNNIIPDKTSVRNFLKVLIMINQ